MYLDMLKTFEKQSIDGIIELATIDSATKVVQLIDEAKLINKWRHQA
jgi:hypothetical protein